jgi:cyclophilin family peptidyl-prolyl cis-trans isomerase
MGGYIMTQQLKCSFFVLAVAAACLCFTGCDEEVASTSAVGEDAEEKAIGMKYVELITNKGRIVLELDGRKAPVTSANFLRYLKEKFYDGTIFHRVIPGFMIQGGGFLPGMIKKATYDPIINESKNGLKNTRGTVAMARTNAPDSATCQFFINVVDNHRLNYVSNARPGYAVFGRVVEGMDVVDAISNTRTGQAGSYKDVPVEPIVIESARTIQAPKLCA